MRFTIRVIACISCIVLVVYMTTQVHSLSISSSASSISSSPSSSSSESSKHHVIVTATRTSTSTGSYMIPSAWRSGSWQLWLTSMLYILVGIISLLGFISSLRVSSESGTYYRASFLGVSTCFLLVRGILVLVYYDNWSNHMFWLYFLSLFLPVFLQFWTFSLLVLFVIRCLYVIANRDTYVRKCIYPMYHAMQFTLFTVCIITSLVFAHQFQDHHHHPNSGNVGSGNVGSGGAGANVGAGANLDLDVNLGVNVGAGGNNDPTDTDSTWDKKPALYVSFLYGLLAIVGTYYAYRSYNLLALTASSSVARRETLRKFVYLIPLFILIFFARFMWNLLYYVGHNPVQDTIGGWIKDDDRTSFDWAFLIFYLIFEIIPTAVIVYVFTIGLKQFADSKESDDPTAADTLITHDHRQHHPYGQLYYDYDTGTGTGASVGVGAGTDYVGGSTTLIDPVEDHGFASPPDDDDGGNGNGDDMYHHHPGVRCKGDHRWNMDPIDNMDALEPLVNDR
jgi:hypothetical protein